MVRSYEYDASVSPREEQSRRGGFFFSFPIREEAPQLTKHDPITTGERVGVLNQILPRSDTVHIRQLCTTRQSQAIRASFVAPGNNPCLPVRLLTFVSPFVAIRTSNHTLRKSQFLGTIGDSVEPQLAQVIAHIMLKAVFDDRIMKYARRKAGRQSWQSACAMSQQQAQRRVSVEHAGQDQPSDSLPGPRMSCGVENLARPLNPRTIVVSNGNPSASGKTCPLSLSPKAPSTP